MSSNLNGPIRLFLRKKKAAKRTARLRRASAVGGKERIIKKVCNSNSGN